MGRATATESDMRADGRACLTAGLIHDNNKSEECQKTRKSHI